MFVQKTITIDVPIAAPVENLAQSTSKVLFYPCSGFDLEVPVTHFAPVIDVFWFVDRGYFRPDHQDTRFNHLDRPADSISPIFKHPDFDYISIRPSKYIFYNFWKLLGSNSEILLIG